MLNTAAWKKLPTDLLTDEDFFNVEKHLPPEYAFAPYMFYITALRKADEDGMFDLDDGVIFAQLMRVDKPSIVFKIANMLRKRRIIYRVREDSCICGFCNWEYNAKDPPRTMEQRRQIVLKMIESKQQAITADFEVKDFEMIEEKKQAVTADFPTGSMRPDETTACEQTEERQNEAPKSSGSNAQEMAQRDDFFCPENDKIAKNVAKNILDDKNRKNVVNGEETERKKDLEEQKENIRQEIKETHTQEEKDKTEKEQFCSAGPFDSPAEQNCEEKQQPWADKEPQEELTEQETKTSGETVCSGNTSELAEQALQAASASGENIENADVSGYLNEFFAKNCYGYKPQNAAGAIKALESKIKELSDEINPPDVIAGVLCSEFLRMHEGKRGEYWYDIPLLPSNMIKPNVWAVLMQHAGKILASKQADNKFIQAEMKAQKEAEADRKAVYDESEAELLKYNISPDDPARIAKLLGAKAKEQREMRELEKSSENVGDIF